MQCCDVTVSSAAVLVIGELLTFNGWAYVSGWDACVRLHVHGRCSWLGVSALLVYPAHILLLDAVCPVLVLVILLMYCQSVLPEFTTNVLCPHTQDLEELIPLLNEQDNSASFRKVIGPKRAAALQAAAAAGTGNPASISSNGAVLGAISSLANGLGSVMGSMVGQAAQLGATPYRTSLTGSMASLTVTGGGGLGSPLGRSSSNAAALPPISLTGRPVLENGPETTAAFAARVAAAAGSPAGGAMSPLGSSSAHGGSLTSLAADHGRGMGPQMVHGGRQIVVFLTNSSLSAMAIDAALAVTKCVFCVLHCALSFRGRA